MDKLLFDRRCRILVSTPVKSENDFKTVTADVLELNGGKTSDKKITGLRVTFRITKTLKKEPNQAEITVYNLAESTRRSLQKKGVHIILDAGYQDTGVFRVFSGHVRTIDHVREGTDWATVFKCGDGERAFRFARVSESFGEGTPVAKVLSKVVGKLGIDPGNLGNQLADISGTFDQGYVASGSTAKVVDELVESIGKTWSIQDGVFQLLDKEGTTSDTVFELTSDSGLIGSPEMGSPDKKGKPSKLKLKSLLIPMKPGRRIKLRSDRYDGLVRCVACTFTGDTDGGDWYTEIQGSLI